MVRIKDPVKCFYLQVYADTLVKKAYDNWNQVEEYDGKSLLNFKQQPSRSSASRNEHMISSMDYPTALEPPLPLQRLPGAPPPEQSLMDPGISVGGKHFWLQIFCSVVFYLFYLAEMIINIIVKSWTLLTPEQSLFLLFCLIHL